MDFIKLLLSTLEERKPKRLLVWMHADRADSHSSALCCLSDLVGVPPRTLTLFHPNLLIRRDSAFVSTNSKAEGSEFCTLKSDCRESASGQQSIAAGELINHCHIGS